MTTFWRNRRVLLTGATGFVGSWAIQPLLAQGAIVHATVRSPEKQRELENSGVQAIACDLLALDDCIKACQKCEIALCFAHSDGSLEYKRRHAATLFRQNMAMTLNILEAASVTGLERIFLTSSAEVYSPDVPVPAREPDAFQHLDRTLRDGYSWSKRISELAASLYTQEHGLKIAIARPGNIYGPGDTFDPLRGRVIPMFIRRVLDREPIVIWGDGQQIRTFLYVEDFVQTALDLTERFADGQAFNVSGGEEITILGLAELIGHIAGRPIEIQCHPDKGGGVPKRVLDNSLAEREVGFRPQVPLAEGLRRTIDFYQRELRSASLRASSGG